MNTLLALDCHEGRRFRIWRIWPGSYLGEFLRALWLVHRTTESSKQLLNEFSPHEVHLYEADSRPGGHTNTVTFSKAEDDAGVDVDT